MSLLLDALRKSANQRHLGTAPGLQEGLRHAAPSTSKRRSWLAPVLVLVILGLLAVGQPWRQFFPGDDASPEESVAEDHEVMQEAAGGDEVTAPVAVAAAEAAPARPTPTPATTRKTVQPPAQPDYGVDQFPEVDASYSSDDAAYIAEQLYRAQVDPYDDSVDSADLEVDDQTGREVLKAILESAENSEEYRDFISQIAADERGELETHPEFEELGIQYPQPGGASNADEAHQLPGTAGEPAPQAAVAAQINAGGAGAAKPEPPARQGRVARAAPPQEQEEDPSLGIVSYYDLPVAVRSSMPAVNIQIRVYDEDPARRFVISGTSRVHEGESLGDGITLHQIRRDGLVLVYQSYVFLWDKR